HSRVRGVADRGGVLWTRYGQPKRRRSAAVGHRGAVLRAGNMATLGHGSTAPSWPRRRDPCQAPCPQFSPVRRLPNRWCRADRAGRGATSSIWRRAVHGARRRAVLFVAECPGATVDTRADARSAAASVLV